ncbi:hypothetical protein O181_099485 [Austropuccinia psidii MF-1]|uniref:Uncharacterized protein n=1 Tax=Austropuccinia psidii MF-1 TaxID=1389203 RepID=A0A9Q3JB26_9BASI|nr:hypothetical protein [Austropuccinia psidii MF-1]
MAHPDFRKFNEQETSQNSQVSESLLTPRQIKAQLCSQRELYRPVILQGIYNQVKKIKRDKLQDRRPIHYGKKVEAYGRFHRLNLGETQIKPA